MDQYEGVGERVWENLVSALANSGTTFGWRTIPRCNTAVNVLLVVATVLGTTAPVNSAVGSLNLMGRGLEIRCYKVYVDGLHYLTYWMQEEAIHAAEQYSKNLARSVKVTVVMEVEIWNGKEGRK